MNYIPVRLNTITLDQIRYENKKVGPSLYLSILQLMVKCPDYKLKLNETNIGILSKSVSMEDWSMMEMIDFFVIDLGIFDRSLYNNEKILYSPELVEDLGR